MIENLPLALVELDVGVKVYDHDTGTPDGTGPSVWITDAGAVPVGRAVCGRARVLGSTARLVCSSDSHLGAARLAQDVAMILDGQPHEGGQLRVSTVAGALEDREDPTDYRWNTSVDVYLYGARPKV